MVVSKEFVKKLIEDVDTLTDEMKNSIKQEIMSIDFEDLKDKIIEDYSEFFTYDNYNEGGREYMGDFWGAPAYQNFGPELEGLDLDLNEIAYYLIENNLKENGKSTKFNMESVNGDSKKIRIYQEMSRPEQDYIRELCKSGEFLEKLNMTNDDWDIVEEKLIDDIKSQEADYD